MMELFKNPDSLLKLGAIFHIIFALFHLLFWKLFDWVQDLKKLSHMNKSVMQILNLRLIFVFLIFAYISYFNSSEMLTTKLGQTLTLAIALFWGFRSFEQILYFGVKKFASNILLLLFISGTLIYGWIYYLSFKL
ncbi:MAG: hypothetical protein AB8B80_06505 [Marinicellaceae bacterium]